MGLGGMMSIYGIASLIVWFGGDKLGVGLNYRIVFLALILLTIPFALIANFFVSRKKKNPEKGEDAEAKENASDDDNAKDTKKSKKAKPIAGDEDIDKGIAEVVDFLKSSNLGTKGKETIYSLPWYLVVGKPKSGKSALVMGSGLNFETLPSQRRSEQKFIRPTKQIDWRVTSEAVFIDTAGRFQLDGAGEQTWEALLSSIKKNRSKRPIDGLILAVNTERILGIGERDIEEDAKILRARLDQATKALKTKFPVYLVFTNADSIEGFRDSFSTSKNDGENLVWGTTIPLDRSENAQALFDSEYELLQDSIMKRRLIRLSAPFSAVRQLRIFNFPLHFGSARRKLGTFITTLFRPNPFSESPFLRGFYFTAVPANRNRKRSANTGQTVEKTYFTRKFFKDVILRDKDLVKTFQARKARPPILGWLLTLLGTLLVLTLLGFSAISFYSNKVLLDDYTKKAEVVLANIKEDENKDPLRKSPEDAKSEINDLENLRGALVQLDEYEREGPPIYMRFGLYSGNRLYRDRLLNIYYQAIEARYKVPALRKVEEELKAFGASPNTLSSTDPSDDQMKAFEKQYELLKAYLMWSEDHKEKAVPTSMADALEEIWFAESKLQPELKNVSKEQLNFYFKQSDRVENEYSGDNSRFPRFAAKSNIVDRAREKLRAFPPYLKALRRITTEVSKEVDALTVDTLMGGNSRGVIEGTYAVPGAYTIEGYRSHVKEKIENANEELSKPDWVLGEESTDAAALSGELDKLKTKYFREYTDAWREMVRNTKVVSYERDAEKMKSALDAFSQTDSPMKTFLEGVAANTNLSANAETGWFATIKSWFSRKKTEKPAGNTAVEKDFRPLFDFVGSGQEETEKKLAVDSYGSKIQELYGKLKDASSLDLEKMTQQISDGKKFGNTLNRTKGDIDKMLGAFSQTPAGQELATLIMQPIAEIEMFFGGTAMDRLRKTWSVQILPKAKEIESGYPFAGQGEADMTKLSAFLNPISGTLSNFYKKNLEKYFEESNGQLVPREGSPKLRPEFVAYLNNAFKLRKALFGENASPNFEYEFKLLPVENSVIELKIDGQTITSEGTASVKLKFPAAAGTETGVSMNFSSTAEETPTSGDPVPTPTSANNSNTNVSTPSPSTDAPLSQFLQDSGGSNNSLKFPGSWGVFKFFDAGAPSKQPGGEYMLTYQLGGKTVKATVKPTGGDLFDRSLFTSVKAPEGFIQ